MSAPTPVLEARGLVKRFGQVVALNETDFDLFPDEITAIIGDNGAGKSTLIKVLSGAFQPDEGELLLDGERVRFRSPLDARRVGIETVYQELAVAPALDIAANIFLGRELRRRGPVRPGCSATLDKRNDAPGGQPPPVGASDRHPFDRPGGREPLRRAAAGRRGRPGCGLGQAARDHGRTDGGAGREGDSAGSRPDPAGPRARACP